MDLSLKRLLLSAKKQARGWFPPVSLVHLISKCLFSTRCFIHNWLVLQTHCSNVMPPITWLQAISQEDKEDDRQMHRSNNIFSMQTNRTTFHWKPYSCSIIDKNRQRHISIEPELEHKPGTNDCESNYPDIRLAELILNTLQNTTSMWYSAHVRHWILQAIDLYVPSGRLLGESELLRRKWRHYKQLYRHSLIGILQWLEGSKWFIMLLSQTNRSLRMTTNGVEEEDWGRDNLFRSINSHHFCQLLTLSWFALISVATSQHGLFRSNANEG